jgi:hypothetical protein
VTVVASVFDSVLGKPVVNMDVSFEVRYRTASGVEQSFSLGSKRTNSSGVAAVSFVPRNYPVLKFRVFANCSETSYTLSAGACVVLDARTPTRLEFYGGKVMKVEVGRVFHLSFRLFVFNWYGSPGDEWYGLSGANISLYLNETWVLNATTYSLNGAYVPEDFGYSISSIPDSDGFCIIPFSINNSGLHLLRATFLGSVYYQESNNVNFTVIANVTPVFVLLDVTPKEFEPGAYITLRATVYNASSYNESSWLPVGSGFRVCFFRRGESGNPEEINSSLTNWNGVASVVCQYPLSGVYVFYACVVAGQQLVSNPLTLTVGNNTTLSLNVGSPDSEFNFPVSGSLLYNGKAIANKQITLKVNGTAAASVNTSSSGCYTATLKLKPINNNATVYQLEAFFSGDNALNYTLYGVAPDGTEYPLCTTLYYYGFKPSANTTTLTVDPKSTQLMTTTKTPEQLQAEAEQSGWFWVEPWFSFFYPWFRLHYRLSVNLPHGNPNLNYGWSPLPFGESSSANETALANIMNDATEGDDPYALAEFFAVIAVPFIIQATTARLVGRSLVGIAVAAAVYGAFLAAYKAWTCIRADGNPRVWLMAFMSAVFVEFASLFLIGGEGAVKLLYFLNTAGRLILQKICNPLQALHALKLNFFDITSGIFALMDFAVIVLYLSMYFQSI